MGFARGGVFASEALGPATGAARRRAEKHGGGTHRHRPAIGDNGRAGDHRRPRRSRGLRFIDFFTANIRNPNTRAAYAVAVRGFFRLARDSAASRRARGRAARTTSRPMSRCWRARYKAPTVKQHLAAIRMLFDWLIVGQVVAATIRPPRCAARSTSSRKARRRCSTATKRRKLLDSIDVSHGRRPARPRADRAAGLHASPGSRPRCT